MKFLFLLTLFSFAALLWATFSMHRHVRRQAASGRTLGPRENSIAARRTGSGLAA